MTSFKPKVASSSLVVFLAILISFALVESATTHKHSHHRNEHNNERLEDGSYRPRDADHHGEDGEHFAEFDHEAILGSAKTADEFHQLSPDESKRRLRILVEKMDLNKDQFIDRHELKAHILRSFK